MSRPWDRPGWWAAVSDALVYYDAEHCCGTNYDFSTIAEVWSGAGGGEEEAEALADILNKAQGKAPPEDWK